MTYPVIGTTDPAHQLETTSNVTAESLEIYSDYTFFGSSAYDWARQLRLRVNTPSSSNVFVDMGLEKDNGTYFYISKPLSTATDPKNIFRIYQNGRVLINRTDATRPERLQVGGNVKMTGNLNVTGTTTVTGEVDITSNLHVTSFNEEKNYIVPVGMIVMWDGEVGDIPPGWALVEGVSGYYLRSNPNQTSVQTGNTSSFTINKLRPHAHDSGELNSGNSTTTGHKHNIGNTGTLASTSHTHGTGTIGAMGNHSHLHNYTQAGPNNVTVSDGGNNEAWVLVDVRTDTTMNSYFYLNGYDYAVAENHNHNTAWGSNITNASGSHNHNYSFNGLGEKSLTHVHNALSSTTGSAITVNLTPAYRKIRLIKKLPYT